MYQILAKHKYDIQPKFEIEKFHTGGRQFLTYKQAQEFKKKLSEMCSSFTYRVQKITE